MGTKPNGNGEEFDIQEITDPVEVDRLKALIESGNVVSGEQAVEDIVIGNRFHVQEITDPATLAELENLRTTQGRVSQAEVEKELGL